MAIKVKKVSINALEKCVQEMNVENITEHEWNGITFSLKHRLGLMEMMTFVDGVVKSCFAGDGAQYTPEVLDFAIRCSLLEIYANFTLPAKVEHRYDIVYGCGDLFAIILENIDRVQYDDILRSIDE